MSRNLKTGTRSEQGLRELDYSYYDTLTLAVATTSYRFFTQGLAGSTKLLYQTNMPLNGQLPTGERLTVHRLKMFYTAHADIANTVWTNIFTMLKQTTIEVKISAAAPVLVMTLAEILGNPLLVSTTALAGSIASPNAKFVGVIPFNKPLIFAEQETIEVLLTHHVAVNAALAGDWLQISLNGTLERKLS